MDQAERHEFPPVPEDEVWCGLRGQLVGVSECVNSCVSPEARPVCWLGKTARDPEEADDSRD